jgi:hypothetical protein
MTLQAAHSKIDKFLKALEDMKKGFQAQVDEIKEDKTLEKKIEEAQVQLNGVHDSYA